MQYLNTNNLSDFSELVDVWEKAVGDISVDVTLFECGLGFARVVTNRYIEIRNVVSCRWTPASEYKRNGLLFQVNYFDRVLFYSLDSPRLLKIGDKEQMVFFIFKKYVQATGLDNEIKFYIIEGENYLDWQYQFVSFLVNAGNLMFDFFNSFFNSLFNQIIGFLERRSGKSADLDYEKLLVIRRFNLIRKISELIGLKGKFIPVFYRFPVSISLPKTDYQLTFEGLLHLSKAMLGGLSISLYDIDLLFALHTKYLIKASKLKTKRVDYLSFSYFKHISKSEIDFGSLKPFRGRRRFVTFSLSKITRRGRVIKLKETYNCPVKLVQILPHFGELNLFSQFLQSQLKSHIDSDDEAGELVYSYSYRGRNIVVVPFLRLGAIPLVLYGTINRTYLSNGNSKLGIKANDYFVFTSYRVNKLFLTTNVFDFIQEELSKVVDKLYMLVLDIDNKKVYLSKSISLL